MLERTRLGKDREGYTILGVLPDKPVSTRSYGRAVAVKRSKRKKALARAVARMLPVLRSRTGGARAGEQFDLLTYAQQRIIAKRILAARERGYCELRQWKMGLVAAAKASRDFLETRRIIDAVDDAMRTFELRPQPTTLPRYHAVPVKKGSSYEYRRAIARDSWVLIPETEAPIPTGRIVGNIAPGFRYTRPARQIPVVRELGPEWQPIRD